MIEFEIFATAYIIGGSLVAYQIGYVAAGLLVDNFPSVKLDTAQHWLSIGKNVAKDRLPICSNDNSGMHLAANSGPNSGRQHLFSAQQRANTAPNSGFLTSRMVCRGNWMS